MHFLETIEGRSGEELTSAILKFLFINSSTMRSGFSRRLRHHFSASTMPTFRDGIICSNEFATSSDDGVGRIDLLIRDALGMVIGLENKFWADFTANQPKKYLKDLDALAKDGKSSCLLVLLVPKARANYVTTHIQAQGIQQRCPVLYWEDLQEDLRRVAQDDRKEIAAAALFLDEYVGRQVVDTQINIQPGQVVGNNVRLANDFHVEFLQKIKECLPEPGRICPAANQIGVHFNVVPLSTNSASPKQWFGFRIREATKDIVMGMSVGIPEFATPVPPWAHMGEPLWGGAFVEIEFVDSVNTIPEWKDRLDQILKPMEKAVARHLEAQQRAGTPVGSPQCS